MFAKLMMSSQNRYFYVQLIAVTLLVSLLPMLALGTLFYHNTNKSMKRELEEANTRYLSQTVNAMEIVFNQIGTGFRQFVSDSAFKEFESFPQGSYYERINGAYKKEDLPVLEAYLQKKASVLGNMSNLKMSNDFILSVYYLDRAKEVVLAEDGSTYPVNEFYDAGWDKPLYGTGIFFPYIMDIRNARQMDGATKQIIPIVYKSANGNFVAINLDVNLIYKHFIQKLDGKGQSSFFVLSQNNSLLLHEDAHTNYGQIADEIARTSAGSARPFVSSLDGVKTLITYKKSEALGWTFVSAANLDRLYASVINARQVMLTLSVPIIAATFVLAYLACRQLYRPILRLLQFIKHPDQEANERGRKTNGEIGVIQSTLVKAFEQQRTLQTRLKESLPAYKEKFIASLVRTNGYSEDEIKDRMAFLGIDFDLEGIMLLIVALDDSTEVIGDIENEKLYKLNVCDRIQSRIPGPYNSIIAEISEDRITVMINCPESQFVSMLAWAAETGRDLKLHLNVKSVIGIGAYCRTVYELKRAYEEAEDALRYRSIAGDSEVIYIEDVRLESTPAYRYPKEREVAMNNYIKNGETGDALRIFSEMTGQLTSQEGLVHFRHIQKAYIQLLVSLAETASELHADLEKLMHEKHNVYAVLLEKNDLGEIVAWFEKMITALSGYVSVAFQEKNNKHVKTMIDMIENESGDQISLAMVADKLNLNPSYLGKIFKDCTGHTFVEYLTAVRMEKSKRMLLQTDMKVKEICNMLGYSQVNYFIKLFRETTGLTPGEYRKIHIPER